MVWEQGPGVDGPGAILRKPGQSSDEIIPIKAIEKDLFSLNTPTDNPAERGTGHRGHPIVLISACRRYSHDPTRYVKHVLHERPLFPHGQPGYLGTYTPQAPYGPQKDDKDVDR